NPPSISANQQYGWRKSGSALDFHKGIDISRIPTGTNSYNKLGDFSVNNRPDVVSIANGTVVRVDRNNGGSEGKCVAVVCDLDGDGVMDIQVRYLHLATIPDGLSVGADISREQVIGKPGGSGNGSATEYGVHLHIDISVYVNDSGSSPAVDNTIDPNAFFRQQVINEE
ncbi:MAG: M23 family metallopeptidase, partial [Clostridia bacterium]|nr:M23 family metallopeptidase [Clostridia bacterium]